MLVQSILWSRSTRSRYSRLSRSPRVSSLVDAYVEHARCSDMASTKNNIRQGNGSAHPESSDTREEAVGWWSAVSNNPEKWPTIVHLGYLAFHKLESDQYVFLGHRSIPECQTTDLERKDRHSIHRAIVRDRSWCELCRLSHRTVDNGEHPSSSDSPRERSRTGIANDDY